MIHTNFVPHCTRAPIFDGGLRGVWGGHYSSGGVHRCAKSTTDILVAEIILATVAHDGQRGLPSAENCLLLLKVVESNPLNFASPEQLNPCDWAKRSIARHIILCVIGFSPFLIDFLNTFKHRLNYFLKKHQNQDKNLTTTHFQPVVATTSTPAGDTRVFLFLAPTLIFYNFMKT